MTVVSPCQHHKVEHQGAFEAERQWLINSSALAAYNLVDGLNANCDARYHIITRRIKYGRV